MTPEIRLADQLDMPSIKTLTAALQQYNESQGRFHDAGCPIHATLFVAWVG